jgi:hypothetical protein
MVVAATPSKRAWPLLLTLVLVAGVLVAAVVGRPSSAAASSSARPAACAHTGSYVWAHLKRCGWAGALNTGYRTASCPGHRLVRNSGSAKRTIHIRKANTLIKCESITGCLSIEAKNVTIRDVGIACTSGRTGENANGTAVIKVQDGASATVNHVTVNGMKGVHACIWHQGTKLAVNALNCRQVNDGIFSWADTSYSSTTGNHFTVTNSYFHAFTTRTANGHIDGYQTEGAAYGLIKHNTYKMTSDDKNSTDSAIAIWDGIRSSHDIRVQGNLIEGGGFSVYAEDYSPSEGSPRGGHSVTKVSFVNNVFSRHLFGCVGYWGVWYPRGKPTDGWRRSGNVVLETGAKIDTRNPSSGGHVCS